MINIRKNVFETNSSSSHSLVYTINEVGSDLKINTPDIDYNVDLYNFYGDNPQKGILGICFGSYGWDGDPCSNFRTKLSYLLTQICHGYGFTYYADKNTEIKIKSQKDWDKVIDNYVMKDSNVLKVLDFIKEKCPNIKEFKFYWYNPEQTHRIEYDYEWYKREKCIENNFKIPNINSKFFKEYKYSKYLIGFGGIDHQSIGTINSSIDLEKYLFDDNLWVIITNDNR